MIVMTKWEEEVPEVYLAPSNKSILTLLMIILPIYVTNSYIRVNIFACRRWRNFCSSQDGSYCTFQDFCDRPSVQINRSRHDAHTQVNKY